MPGKASPTRSELLAAICAAPEDDAPRLVYADHLLETADENERLRGELIVVQCEAARLTRNTPEWRRVLTREHQLRNTAMHAAELDAGDIRWDRGFAAELTTTPKRLERSWKSVFGHPIREITLSELRKDLRPTLKELRFIARTFPQVDTIRFATNREANGAFDLEGFFDLPDKGTKAWANGKLPDVSVRDHLTFLRIDDLTFESPRLGLTPYLALPLPKLRSLSLRSNDGDAMLEMSGRPLETLRWQAEDRAHHAPIATLPHFATLRELDVEVLLDERLARAIASSALSSLALGYDATSEGLAAFEPPARLRELSLDFASRGPSLETRRALPRRSFPHLESLMLGGFDATKTFEPRSFPKLTELSLAFCDFDIASLAKLPRLATLTFTQCGIEQDAEAEVRERLPHVFLTFQ